ncbi:MAG: hypothetical protein LC732_02340, partial [Acidobacteria bacterium]|nr:hypothetical protein [Acidobacteriota bacterium]
MKNLVIVRFLLSLGLASLSASAQLPQATCAGGKVVWVVQDLEVFSAETTENDTTYEIVGKELFIDSPDKSRYLYNTVTPVGSDPNRFHSAHYTLIFSKDRRQLTLIHSNEQMVKVITTR